MAGINDIPKIEIQNLPGRTVGQITDLIMASSNNIGVKMTFADFADFVLKTRETAIAGQNQTVIDAINEVAMAISGPLKAATAAAMTDQTKIYVYTGSESGYTAGNWYYYNGSAWTSGGVYNAVAVQTDSTLAIAGTAADAKATGDAIQAEAAARAAEDADLKSALDEVESVTEILELRNALVYESTETSPDLDVADESGNVLVRFQGGHIKTKEFDSEIATDKINEIDETAVNLLDSEDDDADLYIADRYGNAIAKFRDGGIQTKVFKGFEYMLFRSAPTQYTGDACSLSISHKFFAGDRIVLHVERGGSSWSHGGVVTYRADDNVLLDEIQADCAWLEYTLTMDANEITAEYSASAVGLTNGDSLILEVYLLGDIPIRPTVLRVKKDGTGDYTTLRGALEAIGTSADDVIHPFRIEIYPGTYNVMDDYTSDEIAAAYYSHNSNGFVGPKLFNGMHLIGMCEKAQDVVINCVLSTDDWNQTIRNYISPINMQGSCSIENVMIRAENVRYCIHSDFASIYGKPIKQVIRNVILRGYGQMAYAPNINTYGSGIPRCGGSYLFENVDFGLFGGLHTTAEMYSNPRVLLKHCKGNSFSAYDYNESTDPNSMAEYVFDGCDFMFIISNKDSQADQSLPHVMIRGSGGSSPMYNTGALTLYDTGDVQCNYKINEPIGTVLELYKVSGVFWRKTTNAKKVSGIIVYQTNEETYIQVKGYVRTDRLGLSSFSLYDYIGVDSNSKPVVVQNSDNAIGQIVCTNNEGTIGYMKMWGGV